MKNTLKKGGLDVHRWTGGNIAQYYVTSIYNAKQMPCHDKMRVPEGISPRGKVLFKKNAAIKKFNWKITQTVNACCMLMIRPGRI